MRTFRWGFIGCGSIAKDFATGLLEVADARLEAVAARDPARAQQFVAACAESQRDARILPDYAAVINDPAVDIVYIATTHHNHVALANACIAAGKAVLVEKPMGLHHDEVAELIAHARRKGIFLMEGMWMRFILPFAACSKISPMASSDRSRSFRRTLASTFQPAPRAAC